MTNVRIKVAMVQCRSKREFSITTSSGIFFVENGFIGQLYNFNIVVADGYVGTRFSLESAGFFGTFPGGDGYFWMPLYLIVEQLAKVAQLARKKTWLKSAQPWQVTQHLQKE